MLFQRIESEGLAHYSYIIGHGGRAVVIDPRRDCGVYIKAAAAAGQRITHILETHRNEDYVTGSVELASRTGAVILRSAHEDLGFAFGDTISDGETLGLGDLSLTAMHTPGHTLGSMSFLLRDASGEPWMLFTGDCLFAGDVGRTDFYGPDNLEKMTGLLYHSLFDKILPLGDGVVVCPGHGHGSVCGSAIAERTPTTIGLERRLNPFLQAKTKEEFIAKAGRILEYAPYFRTMERLNVQGPPLISPLPHPDPLPPSVFREAAAQAQILDTRSDLAFASAHVPGSLCIWEGGVPNFAGWFLSYDKPILLVTEDAAAAHKAVRLLARIGYDNVEGYLGGGMLAWHTAGLNSRATGVVSVQKLCARVDAGKPVYILDVRSEEEVKAKAIPGAHHIHITELPRRLDEVPMSEKVFVFCGSGLRATIGASILARAGHPKVKVVLGGIRGWSSVSCPLTLD